MKRTRLLAAAVLGVCGVVAQPDLLRHGAAAEPVAGRAESEPPVIEVAAYPDFPPYPPGFSSYRGLGFMGTCCERLLPCEANAWANYDPHAHHAGWGLGWWQLRPFGQLGLGSKGPRVRGHGCGLWQGSHVGGGQQATGWSEEGEPDAACVPAEKTPPVEAAPELPSESEAEQPAEREDAAGHTAGEPMPGGPSGERSAARTDLRRLPGIENSY